MQAKFLKQIVENVAGESATQLVDILGSKKDVNEFVIAKKLELTINQTRNLLYRLSHMGILSSIRKKDKRKGWYIYFWTLNVLRSLELLEANIKQEITKLETDLKRKKSTRFYRCKLCGVEVTEEAALLSDFICPECGEVYELSDTASHMASVEKQITKLRKELALIRIEREKAEEKKEKKLTRQIKKVEKEKKEKRKQARLKRLREKAREERKKEKKKSAKKKGKKKPVKKKAKKEKKKTKSKQKKKTKTSKKKIKKKKK